MFPIEYSTQAIIGIRISLWACKDSSAIDRAHRWYYFSIPEQAFLKIQPLPCQHLPTTYFHLHLLLYDPDKAYANRRESIHLYMKQMNNIRRKDSSEKLVCNY